MTRARTRARWTIGLTLGAWLLVIAPANAYIDGATGSMIIQGIVAGAMGFALFLKLRWARVKAFFSRQQASEVPATDEQ